MKKFTKLLSCILILVILAVSFASCNVDNGDKLIIATNAEFPPFETKNEADEIVGFDVDLINKVAEKLGMEVEFKNMEFDSVINSIQTGSCNAGISGLTINEERKKSVDFSTPYYNASQVVIVKIDDAVFTGTTADELNKSLEGKTVGVCNGFTGGGYITGNDDYEGIPGATAKSYKNINFAIQDLNNGAIDCIVMDNVVAKKSASTDQNSGKIKVIDVPLTTEQYGIALKKGNDELKEKIDKVLKELEQEGYIEELIKKWIDEA